MSSLLGCHDLEKTDFRRGENCALFDAAGRRYVDFEAGCWCLALGHNHPRINRAMEAQMRDVVHLGTRYPNTVVLDAARDILEVVGIPDGKCVLLSSGSEAVEFGIRAARLFTGRKRLLTFASSYLAAYGSGGAKNADEWCALDWSRCPPEGPFDCLDEIPFQELGGFVFEPGGSGSESIRFPSPALIREIAGRVREAGGLVVVNEITTGFGRTGTWFGFQHYDLRPDIVATGKCLGNGYPVSATALRADIAAKLERDGFHYAQSHQNDPLGAAVAREVIAVLREEHWIERGSRMGNRFVDGLRELGRRHRLVKEARGRGMLLALEFHPHPEFSATTAYRSLLDQGYLVTYSPARNFLRFDPSLTIEESDVAGLLGCLDSILTAFD